MLKTTDIQTGIEKSLGAYLFIRLKQALALASGKLEADLGLPKLDPATDRVMLCGSPSMLRDLKHMLEKRGFMEGNTTKPGDFVIERAFAEQ